MLFFEDTVGVGFHAGGHRQSKESRSVILVLREACVGELAGLHQLGVEVLEALGIGLPLDSSKKLFVIQEKVTGQYALAVKLLKKVARSRSYKPKRIGGVLRSPRGELFSGFRILLHIEQAEALFQVRHLREGRVTAIGDGLRRRHGGGERNEQRKGRNAPGKANSFFQKTPGINLGLLAMVA